MNKRLINTGRLVAMALILALLLLVYLVFLYRLQIVEGENYYNRSNEISSSTRAVTAVRGNILDRYGRVMVSNSECYNLQIDTDKLFANEDPNAVILELVRLVEGFGATAIPTTCPSAGSRPLNMTGR